jgi:glutathione S-transferase
MITLHQPARVWGMPNMSPFCVKLETYFRMTNVEYKLKGPDIKVAPRGRVPYVEIDGQILGDSTLIIDYLKTKHGDPLDAKLTKEQKALSTAVQGMVEERLYFAAATLRWKDPESLDHVRKVFLKFLPPVIGQLIFKIICKDFNGVLHAQGMGQHARKDIVEFGKKDLTAISDLLGDKPFFHGAEPTSIDATLFGFLIQALWVPWDSEIKQHALALKNLEPYCQRMKQKYWADLK